MDKLMLKVTNLSYGYTKKQSVFKDLSFQLDSGKLYALMGGNGSGKSTLLHCLSGFLNGWEGSIHIKNKNLRGMSRTELAQCLSFVPQDTGIVFPYTVESMVLMGRAPFIGMFSRPGARDKSFAHEAMRELGVESLSEKPFNEISGGERQLVLMARALAQNAPIMVLDEPTNHLDFQNQIRILNILRSLVRKKNLLVLMATHDPNHVLQFADQVLLLHKGSFYQHGKPQIVVNKDNIFDVYGVKVMEVKINNAICGIIANEAFDQNGNIELCKN